MSAFAEQWGRPLEKAGYTSIFDAFYRGDKWRRLLSFREKLIIECLISYQNDPRIGSMPSAKQLAYDSGVSYNQTRNLLKRLTNPVIDASGATVRSTLLIPVLLKTGRTRYSMTPLKYELERLEKFPAAEVVRKPRTAPKPELELEVLPAIEEIEEAEELEDVQGARDEWDNIRVALARGASNGQQHWLDAANARGWRDNILVVASNSRLAIEILKKKFLREAQYLLNKRWQDCFIQFEFLDRRRSGVTVGTTVQALAGL